MWVISKLYITVCSNSVSLVPLHPIMISILHHFKELTQCVSEVERIEARVSKNKKELTREKEEEEKQLSQPTAAVLSQQQQRQLKLSEF